MNLFYVEMLHFILLSHTCKHQLRDPGVTCQVEKVSIPRIPDIYLKNLLRRTNGIISKLRHFLPQPTMIQIYNALFQSHLNYILQVWAQNLPKTNRLQKLQKSALRSITFSAPFTPSLPIFRQLKISNINDLVFFLTSKLFPRH